MESAFLLCPESFPRWRRYGRGMVPRTFFVTVVRWTMAARKNVSISPGNLFKKRFFFHPGEGGENVENGQSLEGVFAQEMSSPANASSKHFKGGDKSPKVTKSHWIRISARRHVRRKDQRVRISRPVFSNGQDRRDSFPEWVFAALQEIKKRLF